MQYRTLMQLIAIRDSYDYLRVQDYLEVPHSPSHSPTRHVSWCEK
jgi:hypothetical protein